jgi:hypothetical protein
VGPRAGLDAMVKRNIPNPCRDSNPDHPARSQPLYRLSYHGSSGRDGEEKKFFLRSPRESNPGRSVRSNGYRGLSGSEETKFSRAMTSTRGRRFVRLLCVKIASLRLTHQEGQGKIQTRKELRGVGGGDGDCNLILNSLWKFLSCLIFPPQQTLPRGRRRGFCSGYEVGFNFSSLPSPNRFWGPPSLL